MKKINKITMTITEDEYISPHEGFASENPNYGTDWIYVGVQAVAEIGTGGPGGFLLNTISSSGLWGIDSESSDCYFHQVATEQLDELYATLVELGFDPRDFPKDWVWLDKTNWVNPDKLVIELEPESPIVSISLTEEDVDGIAQRVGIDDLSPENARLILRAYSEAIYKAMHQAALDAIVAALDKSFGAKEVSHV